MKAIEQACCDGATLRSCCHLIGISVRTLQRWQSEKCRADRRMGPKRKPANSLSTKEEAELLAIVNSSEFRDLSPKQIVPRLVDRGVYVASESTIYRLLRRHGQNTHRGAKKPKSIAKPAEKIATGPGQIWTWDITMLRTKVPGVFYYLYLALDIWSRKIVASVVHERESSELSTRWLREAMVLEDIKPGSFIIHQDNGAPMKGTLKACMEGLGVRMSYSRPYVSDDNPYSESLFGTMKMRPVYPKQGFANLEIAREWCEEFVRWYNTEHLHSAIAYVTPEDRHQGRCKSILTQRQRVYEEARGKNPERWSKNTRNWKVAKKVYLNPNKETLDNLRKRK